MAARARPALLTSSKIAVCFVSTHKQRRSMLRLCWGGSTVGVALKRQPERKPWLLSRGPLVTPKETIGLPLWPPAGVCDLEHQAAAHLLVSRGRQQIDRLLYVIGRRVVAV